MGDVHPNPSGQWLNAAVWGDPGFVVVGSNREFLFSQDALHWQRITTDAAKDVWYWDVCYDNGKYVAVGSGVLLWSTTGVNRHEYRIERTINLVDWTVATAWSRGSNQFMYWQAAPFQDARRFWRTAIRPSP